MPAKTSCREKFWHFVIGQVMSTNLQSQSRNESSHSKALSWLENEIVSDSSVTAKDTLRMLENLSEQYSLGFSQHQLLLVMHHLYLMYQKNAFINLTSIRTMPDGLILHSLDSLLFAKVIDEYVALDSYALALDMGTGGGFPGIPLAAVSNFNVELLDSVGKKVNACNEFVEEMGLEDRVHASHARLEEFVKETGRAFDIVTANPDAQEIRDAKMVAKICGFEIVSRETFELPENFGHREIVVLRKISKSKVRLPRKNGEAKNNPLSAR